MKVGTLASEMAHGETVSVDEGLLLLLRDPTNLAEPHGPSWLEYWMVNFTALGSAPVLILVTLLAAGFLVIRRETKRAAQLSFTVLTGMLMVNALKLLFARDRPDIVVPLVEVSSASFPSGHAMNSAIVYFTLVAMLVRSQGKLALRNYVIAASALITVLVGFSRVYLGVHWPTDVIAGWFMGALWAAACFLGARWMGSKWAHR